jgi:hypothetical protein
MQMITSFKISPLKILNEEDCWVETQELSQITWEESFCSAKHTGICTGSSGSGFYIKHENIYYLCGIVSSTLDLKCSQTKNVVFKDIIKYLEFIKNSIS